MGLGRGHLQALGILLQEGVDGLLCAVRDQGQILQCGDLHERLCLRPVVCLLLEHSDGTLQGIHGLGVVLVERVVVGLLDLTHLRRRLLVAGPDGDVLVVLSDFLGQHCGRRGVLLDVRLQHIDLLVGLLDRAFLLHRCVVAELLEGGKLHLLAVFLLFALGQHAVHELDDLLHRRHAGRGHRCGPAAQHQEHAREERHHLGALH
mmetsp:Transcript_79762/g.203125  ORF Transcript_79762/g.203125 Transcript_79762/m.203125 type:complete len:205 (-) Transcript_79762:72-686(-)